MARATATRSRGRQASAHADEGRPDTHVAGCANKRDQDVPQSKAAGTSSPRFCSCPFLPASPSPEFLPFTRPTKRQKHPVPVIPLETYLGSARHRANRVLTPHHVLLGLPTPASLSFVQYLDRRGSHGELSWTSCHSLQTLKTAVMRPCHNG